MSTSKSTDPLAAAPLSPDRVYYATGISLDAEDFLAEQLYHRSRLARALFYLHGSGTAAGLRVDWNKPLKPGDDAQFPQGRDEEIVVQPGLAIDRLGRLIEFPRSACIRVDRWYQSQIADDLTKGFHLDRGGVVVDVFVRFVSCERGKTPAFAAGAFDALDAVAPARLRDSYELTLVIRQEASADLNQHLPQNPWGDFSTGDRPALQTAILNAWHEGSDQWDETGLKPLAEHAIGQDPTALFLARLVLPATAALPGQRPVRTADATIVPDNSQRSFVYAAGAIARWLEL